MSGNDTGRWTYDRWPSRPAAAAPTTAKERIFLLDREQLTSHLRSDDEYSIGIQIIDSSELAWKTNRPQVTDFFDPHQTKVARSIIDSIPEVAVLMFGGYRKAERNRLVLYPQMYLVESISNPVSVLEAKGNFKFQEISHRDCLGSILGTGIKRQKVGDLILTETGCQAVVAAELTDFLLSNWNQIHQTPVHVEEIDEGQINVEPERVKEIRATVPSMRLDAVASSGFGTSRTRMTRDIKAERLKVNWKAIKNPSHAVEEGDIISIRGRGRVVVEEVKGKTRKGRLSLLLKRLM